MKGQERRSERSTRFNVRRRQSNVTVRGRENKMGKHKDDFFFKMDVIRLISTFIIKEADVEMRFL